VSRVALVSEHTLYFSQLADIVHFHAMAHAGSRNRSRRFWLMEFLVDERDGIVTNLKVVVVPVIL